MERFIYALATGCVAALAGLFLGLGMDRLLIELHKLRKRRK